GVLFYLSFRAASCPLVALALLLPSFRLSFVYVSSLFFFTCYGDHRVLHSFPTRRSSDLYHAPLPLLRGHIITGKGMHINTEHGRSEEHTSELQSRFDLVCRLLLEKKKYTTTGKTY